MRYTYPVKPKRITSPDNPVIKGLRRIGKARAGRRAFIVEGPHLIVSALDASAEVKQVFFAEGFKGRGLLRRLSALPVEMYEIPVSLIRRLSGTETPQGVFAVVSLKQARLDELGPDERDLIAVSDGVSDPGNMGTLIRAADAAGADAVLALPGSCDPFMPKALRASAGSVFNIPVVHTDSGEFLEWAKKNRIRLVFTAGDAEKSIYEADLSGPLAFIFGNESRGVSPALRDASSMGLRVPIFGKAESLNVAVTAALCLYEARRRQGHPTKGSHD